MKKQTFAHQSWKLAVALIMVATLGCNSSSLLPTAPDESGSGNILCEPGYDWSGILEIGAKQEACKKGSLWMKLSQYDGNQVRISLHTDPIDDSPCYVGELVGTVDCATLDFTAEGTWSGVYDDGPPQYAAMTGNLAEIEGLIKLWDCSEMLKWEPANLNGLEPSWSSCRF